MFWVAIALSVITILLLVYQLSSAYSVKAGKAVDSKDYNE